jgi:hypothetical protein
MGTGVIRCCSAQVEEVTSSLLEFEEMLINDIDIVEWNEIELVV